MTTKLARVELPQGYGIGAGTAGKENNFVCEKYDLGLGSVFAPSMDPKAKPGDGAWVAVVSIKHKSRPMDATLVPLVNVAGWILLEPKHLEPKDTSGNTQAVVPGRGVGHSPSVSGKVDARDVMPAPGAAKA